MSLDVRELDTMVDDTLNRIINANVGITNKNPGSVVRTIVESVLAESDIQYYQIQQLYNAYDIDTAVESDLDTLVMILGVTRKPATKYKGKVTFGRSTPSDTDIQIQYAQIISTKQNFDGTIIEFMVTDTNAKLPAGQLTVDVNVECTVAGNIYTAPNTVTVMNTPIVGIEYVNNSTDFTGGTNSEDDDSLRGRAKNALSSLGKGTNSAITSAIKSIPGVSDAMVIDMSRGVATSDAVVVTDVIPPSTELSNIIHGVVDSCKPSGVDVQVIYPTIVTVNISVNVSTGSRDIIGNAILDYFKTLIIAESFIVSQMERYVLNAVGDTNADITTVAPSGNVNITGIQIIRSGTITINGVVWNG